MRNILILAGRVDILITALNRIITPENLEYITCDPSHCKECESILAIPNHEVTYCAMRLGFLEEDHDSQPLRMIMRGLRACGMS